LRLQDFRIAYSADGKIDQFYSDLALDRPGATFLTPTKTIKVNEPFVSGGLTVYQSDWKVASVRVRKRITGSEAWKEIVLPMTYFPREKGAYGTFLPIPRPDDVDIGRPYGAAIIARDLRQALVFGPTGKLVAAAQPGGDPIQFDGCEVVMDEIIGSSGVTLKVDPGVKYVYAGFAGTMGFTLASFLANSQVWLSQDQNTTYIGGTTNRLKGDLDKELRVMVEEVQTT
jgi:cytochrome c biogenesis protein